MSYYGEWAPYVPVAERQANARKEAKKLLKKGAVLRPINISGLKIATSFWGCAWCDNLERYADWVNRIPRGKTYARNGSIIDLQMDSGTIDALVAGQELYEISIKIDPIPTAKWQSIREDCAQQVSSMLDLMRGKLPDDVLKRLTDREQGMFPSPKELKPYCSCPDSARVCKHVAASLYGVGHLLDTEPALFFKMRGVDQSELISDAMSKAFAEDSLGLDNESSLEGVDLSALFGIEIATAPTATKAKSARTTKKSTVKKVSEHKGTKKKVSKKKGSKKTNAKVTEAKVTKEVAMKVAKKPVKQLEKRAVKKKVSRKA